MSSTCAAGKKSFHGSVSLIQLFNATVIICGMNMAACDV